MAGLRRMPVQKRGQEKRESLLEAADALFAEVGYEGATTNAIAARAGASVGSLYQFFADKDALLQALAARYREQLHAVHEDVLNAESATLPLGELYDRVIGALAGFHERNPGFRTLFYGSATSPSLARASELLHAECVARVEGMMALRAPHLSPERRRRLATVNVEVMRALLHQAFSGDSAYRASMMAEIKPVLLGYMREALGPGVSRG